MDNYRVTSRRGFGILSPPNQTSPFGFILQVYPSVPEMETLILASYATPNWSIVLESEPLFLFVNVEFDLSGSDISVFICSAREGSPKNEWCLHVLLHVKYHKINRNKEILYFYQNILSNSYRVADRLVG